MSSEDEFEDPNTSYQDILNQTKTARDILNSTKIDTKMSDTEEHGNGTGDNDKPRYEVNLAKLQSTMPAFYALNVRLWLKQVDAHFAIHRVTSDKTKFNLLHVQMRPEILTQVADVIENPPDENCYETLKNRLISAFSDSEQKRLTTLLSGIDLGDRKPSALYNEMRQISGQMLSDDVLKNVWTSKLPENVRGHVVANGKNKSVSQLAELADLVMDVTASSSIAAAHHQKGDNSSKSAIDKLQETVNKLTEAVSQLQQRPRGRSYSRGRSRSREHRRHPSASSSSASDICWYHDTFGSRAKACREPCKFSPTETKN